MSKILIIDDDGIVRDALSIFLTRAGHRVLTAADGAFDYIAKPVNLAALGEIIKARLFLQKP